MNRELESIVKAYATLDTKGFVSELNKRSKPTLIGVISDLMTAYMNDLNSSFLRELVTVSLAGYSHIEKKVGYNGMRHNTYGKPEYCEAKPQNVRLDGRRKLNGGGSFNDYTWERFRKDERENPNILTSGFVEGKLVFIYEFPFFCIKERLREQLKRRFPDGDIPGQYLRSASFTFKHYKDCSDLRNVFVVPAPKLMEYRRYITRPLFEALLKESEKIWK